MKVIHSLSIVRDSRIASELVYRLKRVIHICELFLNKIFSSLMKNICVENTKHVYSLAYLKRRWWWWSDRSFIRLLRTRMKLAWVISTSCANSARMILLRDNHDVFPSTPMSFYCRNWVNWCDNTNDKNRILDYRQWILRSARFLIHTHVFALWAGVKSDE